MSKAKFAAVKELIDEKKYDEARIILKTIDHPVAKDWIEKLDKISPPVSYQPPEPKSFVQPAPVISKPLKKKATPAQTGCALVILTLIIFYFISSNRTDSTPTPAPATLTNDQRTNIAATSTAEQIALVSTQVITNQTATVIALTPPTITPTLAPSATITDTPIPSVTPTSTITPTNTVTPLPTRAPFGLKENPYPVGAPGAIRDGRVQINQFLRNQSAAIKQMNMFNPDPPSGGEWVIANITFYCDISSSETCKVNLMDLELTGKLGSIYTKGLSVLTNDFTGEVFGGGQLTGNVAFTVNSSDSKFIFVVNDLGNRTFFSTGT